MIHCNRVVKVWGVWVARGDAERGHSDSVRRRPCFCDDLFVVGQLRCRVSGRAARGVRVARPDAQWTWRRWNVTLEGTRALRRPPYFCDDLGRGSLPRTGGACSGRRPHAHKAVATGNGTEALRRPLYFCVDVCLSGRVVAFYRRVVSASHDTRILKVWDVATGECVATLERASIRAFRRPLYFRDDLASS